MMLRQLGIPEVICAGVLCVFAMATAHADQAATDRKNEYKVAIAHADAEYDLRRGRTAVPCRAEATLRPSVRVGRPSRA